MTLILMQIIGVYGIFIISTISDDFCSCYFYYLEEIL